MKRIVLFVLTNLAVVLVLGLVASLLGVNRFLTANGLNLGALLGYALVMGFGGAIISLLISKPVAKWSSGVQVIEQPQNTDEAWLVNTVKNWPMPRRSACLKSVFLRAIRTPLPPVLSKTRRWWRCPPACCKT